MVIEDNNAPLYYHRPPQISESPFSDSIRKRAIKMD